MTDKDNITEHEMKLAMYNSAEIAAREYAGQSGSGNAHIDLCALSCIQGSSKFVHNAFRQPLVVDVVAHSATSESFEKGPPESETKRFIH